MLDILTQEIVDNIEVTIYTVDGVSEMFRVSRHISGESVTQPKEPTVTTQEELQAVILLNTEKILVQQELILGGK
ncbi:hypothetical protein QH639_05055 [Lysinibacillus sp. 1 U-2021]|uniref:hypothetical protein n=1 Tax=Lysinibacillus sp. 1 U-2021 TaxID=3039426 RepID=UPI0024806B97|nr:hypothetical protein [Lysinibacillus sp. 1 U-2021]WGT40154.1 hypothetical protein QH639_05055 [Lysinibacillus sp. 1 U-2021]